MRARCRLGGVRWDLMNGRLIRIPNLEVLQCQQSLQREPREIDKYKKTNMVFSFLMFSSALVGICLQIQQSLQGWGALRTDWGANCEMWSPSSAGAWPGGSASCQPGLGLSVVLPLSFGKKQGRRDRAAQGKGWGVLTSPFRLQGPPSRCRLHEKEIPSSGTKRDTPSLVTSPPAGDPWPPALTGRFPCTRP